jgi:hypothetical protein
MTLSSRLPERVWFGAIAVAVIAGLAVQARVTATDSGQFYHSVAGRVFTMFCFFTVQSNLAVGAVSLLTAIRPDRPATAFHVWRLVALVCILITGLVYHLVLARDGGHPTGAGAFANALVHTVVPIGYPLGWLIFGPRGLLTGRHIRLAVIPPVVWLVYTFARGPIVRWYPYPFLDVIRIGYAKSLLHCGFVALLFLALAAGAVLLDRTVPGALRARRRGVGPAQ